MRSSINTITANSIVNVDRQDRTIAAGMLKLRHCGQNCARLFLRSASTLGASLSSDKPRYCQASLGGASSIESPYSILPRLHRRWRLGRRYPSPTFAPTA